MNHLKKKGEKHFNGSSKSKDDKEEIKEEQQDTLSNAMSSASRNIIRNNMMDRKNDDSYDEYEEYRLAREHERSLSKKAYQNKGYKTDG